MIYTIKNNILTAKITDEGAELLSCKYMEKEYLWDAKKEYWGETAPVLFPIVGRALDDEIEYQNKIYQVPKHGFAKSLLFRLEEKNDSSITLKLESNDITKKHYPFDFTFFVTYTINEDKLITTFKVKNTGNEKMGYFIGGHPGFLCPHEGQRFEDWKIILSENESFSSFNVTSEGYIDTKNQYIVENKKSAISLDRKLFEKDTLIFDRLNIHTVTLKHNTSNHGICMNFNDFSSLAVWTMCDQGATFVCIEPWTGMGHVVGEEKNIFKKHDVISLNPKETKTHSYEVKFF